MLFSTRPNLVHQKQIKVVADTQHTFLKGFGRLPYKSGTFLAPVMGLTLLFTAYMMQAPKKKH